MSESQFRERPNATAIVHTHSTHSVAVSCLAGLDPNNVLPPITAYYVMRIGQMPLIPYYCPGDPGLAEAMRGMAAKYAAVLLANHGPVIAGTSLEAAVYSLEETAKPFLMLEGRRVRTLTPGQVQGLAEHFPS